MPAARAESSQAPMQTPQGDSMQDPADGDGVATPTLAKATRTSSFDMGPDFERTLSDTRLLFDSLDQDKKGFLSPADLETARRDRQKFVADEQVAELLLERAKSSSEGLTFEEFLECMQMPSVDSLSSIEKWLSDESILRALSKRLPVGPVYNPIDGIKAIQNKEEAKQCLEGLEDELAELLVQGACKLRKAEQDSASASEANSKFATQELGAQGCYGTLVDFMEGLDAKVGLPNVKVWAAMQREHGHMADSSIPFVTSNYGGTRTTPREEWEIVVHPEAGKEYPGHRRPIPLESFLAIAGCHNEDVAEYKCDWNEMRLIVLLPALSQHINRPGLREAVGAALNVRGATFAHVCTLLQPWVGEDELRQLADDEIARLRRAELRRAEVAALRLYTGPMFVHYNAVLRNFPAEHVATLKGNTYTTTLHAIVSGLMKLQKVTVLPPGGKVYRGMAGVALPEQFWKKDEFGCRGGVEFGFLSTSARREVAVQYIPFQRGLPIVFELRVGQVDRGASLSWLSQYPSEEELLFPPLSNLEVNGDPSVVKTAKGSVTIIPIRINANNKSLTLDELTARRRALHIAMFENIIDEIERDLEEKAMRDLALVGPNSKITSRLVQECKAVLKRHTQLDAAYFNEDETQYKTAMTEAVDIKAQALLKYDVVVQSVSRKSSARIPSKPNGTKQVDAVWGTPLAEFSDYGIVYQLSSGCTSFPWKRVYNRELTEVELSPAMEDFQIDMAWQCMHVARSVIQRVRVSVAANPSTTSAHSLASSNTDGEAERDVRCVLVNPFGSTIQLSGAGESLPGGAFRYLQGLLGVNTGVASLLLSGSSLGSGGGGDLSEILPKMTRLTTLDLRDTRMDESDCYAVACALKILSSLMSLSLSDNKFGEDGHEELAASLQHLSHLRVLQISNIGLSPEAAAQVVDAINITRSVELLDDIPVARFGDGTTYELNLNRLRLHPPEGAMISALLSTRLPPLVTLDIRYNFLGDGGGIALASCMPLLKTLRTVKLWNNEFGEEGSCALASAMRELTGLECLHMCGSKLGSKGGKALSQSMQGLSGLTALRLWRCELGAEGCCALAEALDHMTSLTLLDVGHNHSGEEGSEALCTHVQHLRNLTELDLTGNLLVTRGGLALSESLQKIASIKNLKLMGCYLGPEGGGALAAAIKAQSQLELLDLTECALGTEAAELLCTTSLPHLASLTRLDLPGNGFGGSEEVVNSLASSLQGLCNLRIINLLHNHLSEESAATIAGSAVKGCDVWALEVPLVVAG